MKKIFIYIIIIVSFFCGCASTPGETSKKPKITPTYTITPNPTTTIQSIEETQKIVYITKTGEKYHTKHCIHVRLSCIETTENEATRREYTPCSVCNP